MITEQLQKFKLRNRKASANISGVILTLIVVAVMIVIGVIIFFSTYPTLTALQDSDFSTEANATIEAIDEDFVSSVDLVRIVLIIIGASALIGAVVVGLGRLGVV